MDNKIHVFEISEKEINYFIFKKNVMKFFRKIKINNDNEIEDYIMNFVKKYNKKIKIIVIYNKKIINHNKIILKIKKRINSFKNKKNLNIFIFNNDFILNIFKKIKNRKINNYIIFFLTENDLFIEIKTVNKIFKLNKNNMIHIFISNKKNVLKSKKITDFLLPSVIEKKVFKLTKDKKKFKEIIENKKKYESIVKEYFYYLKILIFNLICIFDPDELIIIHCLNNKDFKFLNDINKFLNNKTKIKIINYSFLISFLSTIISKINNKD